VNYLALLSYGGPLVAGLVFGFIVGNRSGRGEGAALLADAQKALSAAKVDAARAVADAKAVAAKV
jgi:hypothetical protein